MSKEFEHHDGHDPHEKGEAVNERLIVIEKDDRASAAKFLQERFGEETRISAEKTMVCCMDDDIVHDPDGSGKKVDYVHQNPGSFIHNFARGQLTVKQVVDIASQFDIFTSHQGCGAVALVHAAVQADPAVRARFDAFLGKELMDQVMADPDKDRLGKEFSAKIADLAGVDYAHLAVDRIDGHHSAAIAILDFAEAFHGPDMQAAGAYVIDSTRDVLPEFSVELAIQEAVTYGPLAEVIAHGSHSHVPVDKIFTIMIVADELHKDFALQVANGVVDHIDRHGLGERLQVMLFRKDEVLPQN